MVTQWPLNNEIRFRFQASLRVTFHGEISAGNSFCSNNSSVPGKYFSTSNIKLAVDRILYEKLVLLSRRCSHPENGNVDIFILTYHIKYIIAKKTLEDFIRGITENIKLYK
jgi:hypothetical protein